MESGHQFLSLGIQHVSEMLRNSDKKVFAVNLKSIYVLLCYFLDLKFETLGLKNLEVRPLGYG